MMVNCNLPVKERLTRHRQKAGATGGGGRGLGGGRWGGGEGVPVLIAQALHYGRRPLIAQDPSRPSKVTWDPPRPFHLLQSPSSDTCTKDQGLHKQTIKGWELDYKKYT